MHDIVYIMWKFLLAISMICWTAKFFSQTPYSGITESDA